jgi:hypothetical protein
MSDTSQLFDNTEIIAIASQLFLVAAVFQISDGIFVGYSYDKETTNLANYNSGSHEIFLRFELSRGYNKITSPRFF